MTLWCGREELRVVGNLIIVGRDHELVPILNRLIMKVEDVESDRLVTSAIARVIRRTSAFRCVRLVENCMVVAFDPSRNIFNLIRKWYVPTQHVDMIPEIFGGM